MAFKALLSWPQHPLSFLPLAGVPQHPTYQLYLSGGRGREALGTVGESHALIQGEGRLGASAGEALCWDIGRGAHWVSVRGIHYCELHPGTRGPGRSAMGFYTRPC